MNIDLGRYDMKSISPDSLANVFLSEYVAKQGAGYKVFPVNAFQMLSDLGILFVMRPFKKYEGIYIPAEDEEDFPVVGINIDRPITRQRYTAAHELCHHIKDASNGFMCTANSRSEIEKFAERFASELLMPTRELRLQVEKYEVDGFIDLDGVLKVADFFGVSFISCLFKIAYRLHKIAGDTDPETLRKLAAEYKPTLRRKELGLYDTALYEQLFDAIGDNFNFTPTDYACQRFKSEYIFHDSRMEGVVIDRETAADIVMDLRLYKQESAFCKEKNKNIIEVAGLSLAYDYAFNEAESALSIYDAKHINELLFSTAPCPEFGGRYRESNTLVLGAKFETIDYARIAEEMHFLDKDIADLMRTEGLSYSEYIKRVILIHHRLTVIHAFRDGNGRTSRAFANMMLLRRHISPVFFKDGEKAEYKEALKLADTTGVFDPLYERFFKSVLNSYAALTDFFI